MRVLIVNTCPVKSGLLYSAVGFIGFTADCVRSGAEAIQCHLQQRHDLILLSMNLQDYDICSTAQAIRQLERTEQHFAQSLICGLITVCATGMHETCLQNGIDTCVAEPRNAMEAIDLLLHLRKGHSRNKRWTIKRESSRSGLKDDRRLVHLEQAV